MYTKIDNVKIYYDFNDGIKVGVYGPDNLYLVEVREYPKNSDQSRFIHSFHVTSKEIYGQKKMSFCNIQFYMDFEILVYKFTEEFGLTLIWTHRYNDRDKLVVFEVSSRNEEECRHWVDKILLYSKLRGCKPIIRSPYDNINKLSNEYFNIQGVEPYKTYKIGRNPKSSSDWKTIDDRFEGVLQFGNWKEIWSYEHPRSWNFLNSAEIVDDILGF